MSIRRFIFLYLVVFVFFLGGIITVGDLYLHQSKKKETRLFNKNDLSEFTRLLNKISLQDDTSLIEYYFESHIEHYQNLRYLAIYKQTGSILICTRKKIGSISPEIINLFDTIHADDSSFERRQDTLYINTSEGEFYLLKIKNNSPYYMGAIISPPGISGPYLSFWLSRIFLLLFLLLFLLFTLTIGSRKVIINNLNKIKHTISTMRKEESITCDVRTGFKEFDEVCEELYELSTHMRKRYQKYYEDSIHDPLTGAYNLRKFYEDIEHLRKECMTHKTGFVLLIIDVDNFKNINDTLGHLEGDKALKEIVYIIKRNIRDTDAVYRYGGDEFTVILKNTDDDGAYRIAERIRKEVETHTNTTVSIGGSYFYVAYTATELMREADRKLYIAKKLGKNRTIILWEDTESTFNETDSTEL